MPNTSARPLNDKLLKPAGAVMTFVLTCLYLSTFFNRFVGLRSGDGEFAGGNALVHGLLPFRDYFTASPPFNQLKAGLLLALFGDKLIVLRTAGVVERGLIAVLLYFWLTRICRPAHAMLASFATLVLSTGDSADPIASYNHDALLFAVLSGYLLSFVLERDRTARSATWFSVAAGLAAGLSFLAKQTIGLGAVVLVPLVVLLLLWRAQGLRRTLPCVAAFAVGTLVPIAAMLCWIASFGMLKTFLVAIFIKGPAAKAQNGRGDFLTRALNVMQMDLRGAAEVAVGAIAATALLWRSMRARSDNPEPLHQRRVAFTGRVPEMIGIAALAAACVGIGWWLSAHHHGGRHPSWAVRCTSVMLVELVVVVAAGLWMLLRNRMRDVSAQVLLLAAASLSAALMMSLSFPIFPAMMLPGVGLVLAGALAGTRKWAGAPVYALIALLCVGAVQMKLSAPFSFGFFTEASTSDATAVSDQQKLAGMRLPPEMVRLVDGVAATTAAHTQPGDTIFAYPEMSLFYSLTDRMHPTETGSHNVDVVSDALAESEAARLLAHPPAVLIYLPETKEQSRMEERLWRNGHRMGQRDIAAAVESLARTYTPAGVYPTLPGNQPVYVFVRPRSTQIGGR